MLKARIEESFKLINHHDISDAFAALVKQPKPLASATLVTEKSVTEKSVTEKSVAEKSAALSPRTSVACLDDIQAFLIPAYYQTDD